MSTATDQQAVVIVRFVRPLLGFDDLEFEMSAHPGGYPWFSLHSRDADFPSFLTVDLGAVFDNLEIDIPDDVASAQFEFAFNTEFEEGKEKIHSRSDDKG